MLADISLRFALVLSLLAVFAGAAASVVGFGIGSLLTPFLALRMGADVAIAVVVLPHLAGGTLRGWRLRHHIDRTVLLRFGALSAAGALLGALFFSRMAPLLLTRILGLLLLLTASAGLAGWTERWQPRGLLAWALGLLSGFFGGVAGNQGGLRAAGLSAFNLAPVTFVATSTVIGIFIDLVRAPVYVNAAGPRLLELWQLIGMLSAGVLLGTLAGERLLLGLSAKTFRALISTAIGILGLWFLFVPA
ncbi:MAG TPA: sulfite exporter TauE/SafE family protein [Gammaproteobacteria bacterium]|nr:sulfite exporter TauE/SafE family protein [Gammaproteobacteria bacterium]